MDTLGTDAAAQPEMQLQDAQVSGPDPAGTATVSTDDIQTRSAGKKPGKARMKAGQTGSNKKRRAGTVALVLLVLVVGICVGAGLSGILSGDSDSNQGVSDETRADVIGGGRIGYATEGVVATDPETLQQEVDAMYEKAKEPGIALEYKDVAVSSDGKNFDCYIANSEKNDTDMFIAIYADQALTDELFLSELLRPGTRFEKITLERTLEPGAHTGYVVYTQVTDETDEEEVLTQVIQAQIATTINLVVNS